jgi:hypothetical protein
MNIAVRTAGDCRRFATERADGAEDADGGLAATWLRGFEEGVQVFWKETRGGERHLFGAGLKMVLTCVIKAGDGWPC